MSKCSKLKVRYNAEVAKNQKCEQEANQLREENSALKAELQDCKLATDVEVNKTEEGKATDIETKKSEESNTSSDIEISSKVQCSFELTENSSKIQCNNQAATVVTTEILKNLPQVIIFLSSQTTANADSTSGNEQEQLFSAENIFKLLSNENQQQLDAMLEAPTENSSTEFLGDYSLSCIKGICTAELIGNSETLENHA